MIMRKRIFVLAAVAGLLVAAIASAQQAGTASPQSGFSVENLIMELSSFLPEQYAGFGGFRGGFGGPQDQRQGQQGGGATGQAQQGGTGQAQQGTQGGGTGNAGPAGQAGQRPAGFDIPQFKRDPKLYLTAKQVDALLPVLLDLQKTPFPTPSLGKKVTATVDSTLTKQQKDAYAKYVKERDKAIEELRKQFASRQGQAGQGGQATQGAGAPEGGGFFILRDEQAGQGQAGQGQRQQIDPAEMRKRMLEAFIKNLQEYRKGLS